VTVPVVTIQAVNDNGSAINSASGGTSIANVLVNDTLSGLPATTGNVTITATGSWPAGVTLNTGTGAVSVAPGTAAGTYTPQYQICDQANPTFCSTATVTVPVVAIQAVNDSSLTIDGDAGGNSIANVLVNDTLNGVQATTSTVTITAVGTWPPGITLNTGTGAVSVAPGTAAGTYTPEYQICDQANPAICSTAIVTVPVVTIQAINDISAAINGAVGGTSIPNVLVNDTLNGSGATTSNVNLTVYGTWPSGLHLDIATGAVTVDAGTAYGTYTPQYQICDMANPTFCSIATVTVPVVAIDAVNDTGAMINGVTGGQALSDVLVNDTLNGAAATTSNVILTQVSTTHSGVTLNTSDGSINVAAGTPAGNYTVTYQICSAAYSTVCDTATVSVPVLLVEAKDDFGRINTGATGTPIPNVLPNDLLGGSTPATTGNVILEIVPGTWPNGISLDIAMGAVNVTSGQTQGIYTGQYRICDQANPSICDTATVTITVGDPTAVLVSAFKAVKMSGSQVELDWETYIEVNMMGFNLFRSEQQESGYTLVNDTLIIAQNPGMVIGSQYTFVDPTARPGVTYYYRLVVIQPDLSTVLAAETVLPGFSIYFPAIHQTH
jgi:hypothetical protein